MDLLVSDNTEDDETSSKNSDDESDDEHHSESEDNEDEDNNNVKYSGDMSIDSAAKHNGFPGSGSTLEKL